MNLHNLRQQIFFKAILFVQIMAFVASSVAMPQIARAQSFRLVSAPGSLLTISQPFTPTILRGFKVDPANPLLFDFIVDKGQANLDEQSLQAEGKKLIKYFLTSLTVPSKDLWVNLSPYEKDRIVADKFGVTQMGRDLLEQDYLLKQLASSLMYPETKLGADFWKRVYARAQQEFGSTDIPIDTFNKVWIMPGKSRVYEKGNAVYVVEAPMKVMLEQDYKALANSKLPGEETVSNDDKYNVNKFASDIVKEVIIPEITKEVNEGKNFAQLRQVHYALVLAAWYERKIKESILGKTFAGQNKVAGSESDDRDAKEKIYAQYLEAFKKGAYNYIKEDIDAVTNEVMPRKYFAGGYTADKAQVVDSAERTVEAPFAANLMDVKANLAPNQFVLSGGSSDQAMNIVQALAAKTPSLELINEIKNLNIKERKKEEISQIISSLRDSLIWRSEMHSEIKDALDALVLKVTLNQPTTTPSDAVLLAMENAAHDVGGVLFNANKVVVIKSDDVLFGVAKVNDNVYIENKFIQHIESLSNSDERLRALFAGAFSETVVDGILTSFNSAKKRLGIERALEVFGIKPNEDPTLIINNFRNLFYKNDKDEGYKKLREDLQKNGYAFPELLADSDSDILLKDTLEFAKWAAARILANYITGDIQDNVRPMLAFAANPATSAHLLALLVTTAEVKARQGDFDRTGDDHRKLILTKNKLLRQQLTKMIASKAGSVFSVPESFKEMNGEERIDQFLDEEGLRYSRDYIYGTDHHKAFAKLGEKIDQENARGFWYYYRKPAMIYILKALQEHHESYGLSQEQMDVLSRVISSMEDPEGLYAAIKEGANNRYTKLSNEGIKNEVDKFQEWLGSLGVAVLPDLDVVSKIWLNNYSLFGEDAWKITLAVLPRDPIKPDLIRDQMIAGNFKVDNKVWGQPMRVLYAPMPESTNKVSSTASRNALLQMILLGTIDQDGVQGFFSIPTEGWQFIISNKEYRQSLLVNQYLPFSSEIVAREGGIKELEKARSGLEKELEGVTPGIKLSIVLTKETNKNNEIVDSFSLGVQRRGENVFKVQVRTSVVRDKTGALKYQYSLHDIESKLTQEEAEIIKKFNGVDPAQEVSVTDNAANAVNGGIDFDINNVDMDIQSEGAGVQFNFDPAMLNDGKYDGLVPVIRSVTPITDLPAFLGGVAR